VDVLVFWASWLEARKGLLRAGNSVILVSTWENNLHNVLLRILGELLLSKIKEVSHHFWVVALTFIARSGG